ncbi:MAG TPA: tetratricopeptide repeat protein [Terracidiphilus sp.]|nr:tetratricopeptide repeat protein [Terracidiphilus sp.]
MEPKRHVNSSREKRRGELRVAGGRDLRVRSFCALLVAVITLSVLAFLWTPAFRTSASRVKAAQTVSGTGKLTIDYPRDGSIFPPEITAPVFLFHDSSEAKRWTIEVAFDSGAGGLHLDCAGDYLQPAELDTRAGTKLEWTAEQSTTHTWKPDDEVWKKIKLHSVMTPVRVTIQGYADAGATQPVSRATVAISTSSDPAGAPIFYRDVPLMIAPTAGKGAIQPLPPSALPLIKWELRYIGQPRSQTVMENLPTCANCHSFSRDGKTLGLDMDGPRNDKGLYALVPVSKEITIANRDVLRWESFKEDATGGVPSDPTVKRFGFMSQVSPDGRYVITSIAPPGTKDIHGAEAPGFAAGVVNRLFSMNYQHLDFTQVFYPTRGILAWYDRSAKKLRALPGADDPDYVQTSAFWSPDGKYLIFSRAKAQDPYPPGAPKPTYANDPNEPLVQYDLYKIPFNEGRGGKAVPVAGASQNGMSNNFPKVSPDGRWIVFVQNRTGLLMRPDSKLYMVPFEGGKARLMNCNTPRMNSWHTFSPSGRWLAFSSKGRSPYTQLMLTHIDAQGNDSPAIMVENTTAANRAVNIPEFLNVSPGGLEKIDPQATEFYRFFNRSYEAIENNDFPQAIASMRSAIERDPDDPLAHYGLATALSANGQEREALDEYRIACKLNPKSWAWLNHLAVSLANNGEVDEAIATWRQSLQLNPSDPGTETDLGTTLFESGRRQEGYQHLQNAVILAPKLPDAHNHLGLALAEMGQTQAAVEHFQKAIELLPSSAEFRFNLGYALDQRGDYEDAIGPLEKSVGLSQGRNWHCLAELAKAYQKTGRSAKAVETERLAIEAAERDHNDEVVKELRDLLAQYESTGNSSTK